MDDIYSPRDGVSKDTFSEPGNKCSSSSGMEGCEHYTPNLTNCMDKTVTKFKTSTKCSAFKFCEPGDNYWCIGNITNKAQVDNTVTELNSSTEGSVLKDYEHEFCEPGNDFWCMRKTVNDGGVDMRETELNTSTESSVFVDYEHEFCEPGDDCWCMKRNTNNGQVDSIVTKCSSSMNDINSSTDGSPTDKVSESGNECSSSSDMEGSEPHILEDCMDNRVAEFNLSTVGSVRVDYEHEFCECGDDCWCMKKKSNNAQVDSDTKCKARMDDIYSPRDGVSKDTFSEPGDKCSSSSGMEGCEHYTRNLANCMDKTVTKFKTSTKCSAFKFCEPGDNCWCIGNITNKAHVDNTVTELNSSTEGSVLKDYEHEFCEPGDDFWCLRKTVNDGGVDMRETELNTSTESSVFVDYEHEFCEPGDDCWCMKRNTNNDQLDSIVTKCNSRMDNINSSTDGSSTDKVSESGNERSSSSDMEGSEPQLLEDCMDNRVAEFNFSTGDSVLVDYEHEFCEPGDNCWCMKKNSNNAQVDSLSKCKARMDDIYSLRDGVSKDTFSEPGDKCSSSNDMEGCEHHTSNLEDCMDKTVTEFKTSTEGSAFKFCEPGDNCLCIGNITNKAQVDNTVTELNSSTEGSVLKDYEHEFCEPGDDFWCLRKTVNDGGVDMRETELNTSTESSVFVDYEHEFCEPGDDCWCMKRNTNNDQLDSIVTKCNSRMDNINSSTDGSSTDKVSESGNERSSSSDMEGSEPQLLEDCMDNRVAEFNFSTGDSVLVDYEHEFCEPGDNCWCMKKNSNNAQVDSLSKCKARMDDIYSLRDGVSKDTFSEPGDKCSSSNDMEGCEHHTSNLEDCMDKTVTEFKTSTEGSAFKFCEPGDNCLCIGNITNKAQVDNTVTELNSSTEGSVLKDYEHEFCEPRDDCWCMRKTVNDGGVDMRETELNTSTESLVFVDYEHEFCEPGDDCWCMKRNTNNDQVDSIVTKCNSSMNDINSSTDGSPTDKVSESGNECSSSSDMEGSEPHILEDCMDNRVAEFNLLTVGSVLVDYEHEFCEPGDDCWCMRKSGNIGRVDNRFTEINPSTYGPVLEDYELNSSTVGSVFVDCQHEFCEPGDDCWCVRTNGNNRRIGNRLTEINPSTYGPIFEDYEHEFCEPGDDCWCVRTSVSDGRVDKKETGLNTSKDCSVFKYYEHEFCEPGDDMHETCMRKNVNNDQVDSIVTKSNSRMDNINSSTNGSSTDKVSEPGNEGSSRSDVKGSGPHIDELEECMNKDTIAINTRNKGDLSIVEIPTVPNCSEILQEVKDGRKTLDKDQGDTEASLRVELVKDRRSNSNHYSLAFDYSSVFAAFNPEDLSYTNEGQSRKLLGVILSCFQLEKKELEFQQKKNAVCKYLNKLDKLTQSSDVTSCIEYYLLCKLKKYCTEPKLEGQGKLQSHILNEYILIRDASLYIILTFDVKCDSIKNYFANLASISDQQVKQCSLADNENTPA